VPNPIENIGIHLKGALTALGDLAGPWSPIVAAAPF
jgi:hypothetical protein